MLMIEKEISGSDHAALNEILRNHLWFKNVFLKNQPTNSELDPDFRVEDHQDYREFIRALVSKLAVNSYRKGQLIINKGEKGEEMFIVNQGICLSSRGHQYIYREKWRQNERRGGLFGPQNGSDQTE